MTTRSFNFIVGAETSTLPTVGTPSADDDLISKGYADGHYTQGGASVASIAVLKAIASADRADGDTFAVKSTNTLYIFDADSAVAGDNNNVLAPDAGTGRWIKVRENQLTVSRALTSDANGYVAVANPTTTELNRLVGVASEIMAVGSAQTVSGVKTHTASVIMNAQNETRYADLDSTNYAAIKAPAVLASDYTLTLPINDGSANQALTSDGSGVLSWQSVAISGQGTLTTNASTGSKTIASGETLFHPNLDIQSGHTYTVDSGGFLTTTELKVNGTLAVNGTVQVF